MARGASLGAEALVIPFGTPRSLSCYIKNEENGRGTLWGLKAPLIPLRDLLPGGEGMQGRMRLR